MTIRTARGKEFQCDMAVENPSPPRLYLSIINTTVSKIASTFTNPKELPVEGYTRYTAFSSMNMTPEGGVIVCLKP